MRTLLLALCSSIVNAIFGQGTDAHERCMAHTITERLLLDQGLEANIRAALPRLDHSGERGDVLTVPVVVHVVWNTAAENVPTSAIEAMINEMNQDFSQSNSDVNSVRAPFASSIANVGIQFCLAQVDPLGNPTTGITRTQTTDTWFDPDTQTNAMKSAPLGKAPWNPSQYLNIWICDITSGAGGGSITLGYAYLPVGGVVGTNIDGLVVDYQYGLPVGSRTATHEIGHYFGLEHPWADGGCSSDDGFTDTPNTDTPTFSCANTNLQKCGTLTQYENFMDYSNCPAMYTNQQRTYMRSILNGVRSSLLNSPGCIDVPPPGLCVPTSANGPADGDFINGVTLGSINNVNSGGTNMPAYTNYSGTWSTSLQQGSTHTISIQGGDYQPNHFAAWIDYDQNDVFQAGEKLGEFTITAPGQTQTITFTVPAGAITGNTVMRVRGVFHNTGEPTPTDPCYAYGYGETEDYGIMITTVGGPCIPTSANGPADGDFINGVTLGSINNVNSGGTNMPAYTNYSGTWTTSLQQGSTHTISIQGGDYQPNHFAAWIDYDQNDVFQASEKLGEFTITAPGQTQTITFTVPAGAITGNTVMRVRGVFHNTGEPTPTDPCYAYGYGETEDYGITIAPVTPGGICIPTSINGPSDGDFINSVSLGDINNVNTGSIGGLTYNDYMLQSTLLVRGGGYELIIQSGEYAGDHYAAWIDHNGDEVFTPDEKLGEFSTTTTFETGSIAFSVPMTANLGPTRMRVRGVYHLSNEPAPSDPCYDYAYGETEDYTVVIDQSTSVDTSVRNDLLLYPNPASDLVTLQLPAAGSGTVDLIDAMGRQVASMRIEDKTVVIPLKGIASGQYFLKVQHQGAIEMLRLNILGDQ